MCALVKIEIICLIQLRKVKTDYLPNGLDLRLKNAVRISLCKPKLKCSNNHEFLLSLFLGWGGAA
jgi:hypothetical protein